VTASAVQHFVACIPQSVELSKACILHPGSLCVTAAAAAAAAELLLLTASNKHVAVAAPHHVFGGIHPSSLAA
jgi:hypothetical protein